MKLECAKTYILYCKFPDMNRFEMLAPGGYTTRRNEYPEAQFEFRLA
jgi:hypothetical protein